MSDSYYPFYVGDYLRDTGDLSLTEHGAYMILLHHYYTQGGLTADMERLYRVCRAFSDEEQQAINTVVERFFYQNGDGTLKNKKAEKIIAERTAFRELQSARGKAGADARWGRAAMQAPMPPPKADGTQTPLPEHKPGDGQPSPSPSPSPSPTPPPTPKKEKNLFVETDAQFRLAEYLFARMRGNNPQAKEPNFQVWAQQFDLMLRVDKRTENDIQAVIDYCQEDYFWKSNILSAKKLRERFDQLWMKMAADPIRKRHSGILKWLEKQEAGDGQEA
jgi:uncharacterized protein YdaU (DUF1376 family)